MNPYLLYALLLVACIPPYILYVHFTAKGSIVFKIALIILPTLMILCYTSFSFALSQNYWLFVPALVSLFLTFTFLTRRIRNPISIIEKNFDDVAHGNLKIESSAILRNRKDEFGTIFINMESMTAKLNEVVSSIKTISANLAGFSDQIAESSTELSQGASVQATSTEEVSSSMEEITANIIQNTDNSKQAGQYSKKAFDGIIVGVQSAQESAAAMKTIAETIKIVDDIAFQTNILALNAAVEAARAGEHGKGFAVVAAEVRKLAERSKKAAEEISVLSRSGIDIADKAGEQLNSITPDIESTATIVNEIVASGDEQKSGAEQINMALQVLNQETQKSASTSEEMASNAEELAAQANELRDILEYFHTDSSITGKAKLLFEKNPVGKKGNTEQSGISVPRAKTEEHFAVQKATAQTEDDDDFIKF
jgi:methyl-accepting chemotaxis protein